MLSFALRPSVAPFSPSHGAFARGRLWLGAGAAVLVLATGGIAADPVPGEFGKSIQLAPFVVKGKQLTISIHARSKGDRRYAEDFAEKVVKVVYEAVTEETGKGLVIIGKKGEPHPVFVFRKFLTLAQEGKLDAGVAARGPELQSMLNHWQDEVGDEKSAGADGEEAADFEFEQIITALPLPLEGVGAKLYQLAWAQGFDEAKVEAKLRALRPADLDGNLFAHFDWVFYLPPRGAFEQAIDNIIADALKEEKAGFFERTVVKGAMLVAKPFIRKMIEGLRRSVMFSTVVKARSGFNEAEVSALTDAYMDALLNEHKGESGSEHDRAVKAVRAKVRSLEEKPAPVEQSIPETEMGKSPQQVDAR